MNYPINEIRKKFPMIKKKIINLDNASNTYQPISVINKISDFYKNKFSSYNKSTNYLSENNYYKVEISRKYISKFINSNSNEIIFIKSFTEGMNLISNSISKILIYNKDNILISLLEHHSNILPWYNLSIKKKIKLNVIPIYKNGNLNLNKLYKLINNNTKIISISQISNVLGIENPIIDIIKNIRLINKNIIVIIDGSQSISHLDIDVKKIDCDFYIFSGYKIYSLYGIGILYAKKHLIDKMRIYEYGSFNTKYFNFNEKPIYLKNFFKFEYINIPNIFSLEESLKFINNINIKNIIKWENKIINYALDLMKNNKNIIIYGNLNKKNLISFNIKNINYYDIGAYLKKFNISIRVGNQCCIPLMKFYNVNGMCRISFALYNNYNEIDNFIEKLNYIIKILNK